MLVLILLYVGIGLLFMALAVPMIRGRIKPNLWYGFRTRKTLSSARVWYAANAYSGRLFFVAGLLTVAVALFLAPLALLAGIGSDGYAGLMSAFLALSLLYTTWLSLRYVRRL